MRVSLFLLFVCVCQLMATEIDAQNTEIKISRNNMTLRELIEEIEAQTDYLVVFRNQDVNLDQRISFEQKSGKIIDYLDEISEQIGLSFQFDNKYITVVPKNTVTVVNQEKKQVSGKIVDAAGIPIVGANVVEKGTTNGTITDMDGNFTLEVSEKSTLVVSYIGYASQEIVVGAKSQISIKLHEDTEALDEVVVVGYGTMKKSDVTTSVASLSSEKIQNRAVVSVGEAMAGQVPGVMIQQTNGAPGGEGLTIKVRGTGSITQSSDPLYVVDGYPMEDGAFRLINPSDIESIQVLKDASSTAIYGSRGANGVIIITTKKGQVGKPSVSLNAYVGFQQREKKIEMMNRDQYVQWFIDGRNQAWLDAAVIASDPDQSPHTINDPNSRRALYPSASSQYMIPDGTGSYKYNFLDPESVAQMPDNDWQDLLYRNALMQQYELSVSGGSENTRYTFSGSYTNQDGIVLNTDYERFNFRTNVQSKILDKINVGMSLMAYSARGTEQANGKDSPVLYALNLPPIYPLRNEDGTYGSMVRNPEILAGDVANPIGIAEQVTNKRKRYGWVASGFLEWEIIKNLKYKLSINGSIQDNVQKRFEPSYVDFDASKAPRPAKGINDRATDRDWVIENTLNYSFNLRDKHDFNILLGYTTQGHSYEHMNGEARSYATDNIQTLNAGTMYSLTSDESEYSMISYLGRVNYAYDNRYLLTATIRSDGSSRFGANKRWGTFPSVSVGWRISQEKFMQNVKQISDLKLRASFGISGNNRIGNYSSIGLLSTGFYPTGGSLQNVVNPNTMSNVDLGWEKVRQFNVGFDLGLFNNRVRLEADFYDSQSIDLLLDVPVPTITGYSSQIQNIGKVRNRGMEYTINTQNINNDDFTWSSNFNISFNQNKVLELGPDGRPIYGSATNANNAFITTIGHPIASFYGYKQIGIFHNQEELDKYPHLSGDKVGDGRYEDVNKDGILDQNDKTILGDNNPVFTAGFSNSFTYKNFTLDIQFTGSYGAEVFSFYKRMCGIYHGDRNAMIEQLDRWRSEDQPGDGIHFRPTRTPSGWQRDPSSAWVQDASYLRLRNLTFGYNFDEKLAKKMKMQALRLYVTGNNIFTVTKYVGYDPETSSESGLSQGGDYLGYPTARSFIIGANITF